MVNEINFSDLMVLASYESLKNFNAENANIPNFYVDNTNRPLDVTIDAISAQFAKDFKKNLTEIAYQKFEEFELH